MEIYIVNIIVQILLFVNRNNGFFAYFFYILKTNNEFLNGDIGNFIKNRITPLNFENVYSIIQKVMVFKCVKFRFAALSIPQFVFLYA